MQHSEKVISIVKLRSIKYFMVLAILVSSIKVLAQSSDEFNTHKLASLCRVWGFLKYYHPIVAKGRLDWDAELINKLKVFRPINDKKAFNLELTKWLNSIGDIPDTGIYKASTLENVFLKPNFDWITEDSFFDGKVVGKLMFILKNHNQYDNYLINI